MSKESWLERYYPVPAEMATQSELEAVEHAIRKFQGLKPKVMSKHGVWLVEAVLCDGPNYDEVLRINSVTCALCERHRTEPSGLLNCEECILSKVRGVACDRREDYVDEDRAPYQAAVFGGYTTPMLELLHEARRVLRGKS